MQWDQQIKMFYLNFSYGAQLSKKIIWPRVHGQYENQNAPFAEFRWFQISQCDQV